MRAKIENILFGKLGFKDEIKNKFNFYKRVRQKIKNIKNKN
jgi:hypothetical protein